jgi:syntaxin 16
MDLLPPRWIDVQDEVTEILTDVTLKAASLEKLHQKHVLPGFDDEHIKQREEREIDKLTQEITRGFHECQRAIQRIEKMVKEAQMAGTLSQGDATMAKNIQIALAARVQEVSASFRKKQSNYLNSIPTPCPFSCYTKLLTPDRIARSWRIRFTISTAFNPSPESILGSLPSGI